MYQALEEQYEDGYTIAHYADFEFKSVEHEDQEQVIKLYHDEEHNQSAIMKVALQPNPAEVAISSTFL